MSRTYVVTGSTFGIGLATKELLESRGNKVIGVGRSRNADVVADLSTAQGREDMLAGVTELSNGVIDGLVAAAGISEPNATTARLNYFGTISTLENLQPLLARSAAPRAVAVSSFALLWPVNDDLVASFEAGDEARAVGIADSIAGGVPGGPIYFSAKRAMANWVRRMAPTAKWAGAGIALNVVAPGMTVTRQIAHLLENEEIRKASEIAIPRPLNGTAEAIEVARLLAWIVSEENSHLCGQVIFIDGGSEAIIRGEYSFNDCKNMQMQV